MIPYRLYVASTEKAKKVDFHRISRDRGTDRLTDRPSSRATIEMRGHMYGLTFLWPSLALVDYLYFTKASRTDGSTDGEILLEKCEGASVASFIWFSALVSNRLLKYTCFKRHHWPPRSCFYRQWTLLFSALLFHNDRIKESLEISSWLVTHLHRRLVTHLHRRW